MAHTGKPLKLSAEQTLTIDYTNWKGIRGERKIVPVKIWFGSTKFHPEEQWLLDATDVAKNEVRTFALVDIHSMRK